MYCYSTDTALKIKYKDIVFDRVIAAAQLGPNLAIWEFTSFSQSNKENITMLSLVCPEVHHLVQMESS